MRTRADKITRISLASGDVDVDEAGFLVDPSKWSPEFARYIAGNEDITLADLHWQVIEFMRDYLSDHGVAADVRHVTGFLAEMLGIEKRAAKTQYYALFPAGHVPQACKMSGMRQPRAWSTG